MYTAQYWQYVAGGMEMTGVAASVASYGGRSKEAEHDLDKAVGLYSQLNMLPYAVV